MQVNVQSLPPMNKMEYLPEFFKSYPFRYGHIVLAEQDKSQSSFVYALNSALASKRAGRLISYAIAHRMQVARMSEISEDEVESLTRLHRPDLEITLPPRNGILRLATTRTIAAYWAEIYAALKHASIHTD